jgi:hypothetical protein
MIGAMRYKLAGRGFHSPWCHDLIFPAALWPWVDSASNRNDYQKYFLGVKAARA